MGLTDTGLCVRCEGSGVVLLDAGLGHGAMVAQAAVNGKVPGSSPGAPVAGPVNSRALSAHDGTAWVDWLDTGVAAHG